MLRLRLALPLVLAIVPGIAALAASAKTAAPKPLTIAQIMRGPDLYGVEPSDVRWSLDSSRVYFRWKEPGEPRREPTHWYRFDNFGAGASQKPRRLTDEEADSDVPPPFEYSDPAVSRNNTLPSLVFEKNGDLYRLTAGDAAPMRLTDTPAIRETDPVLTADEKRVVYRDGNNLFCFSTENAAGLQQLTDIRAGNPPKEETKPTEGVAKIASDIERELFDTVRARAEEREKETAKRREREAKQPRAPYYLGDKERLVDMVVSPTAEQVLLFLSESGGPTPSGVVPQYITEDGFVAAPKARPNVGWEKQDRERCILLNVTTGKPTSVTLPDDLKDRKMGFQSAKYDRATGRLALLALADDWHDRWIFEVDTKTGKATVADAVHDNAWIGGPGWDVYGWADSGMLYAISEASGWARLVTISPTGERTYLSPDKSEVSDVQWRPASGTPGTLYFTSSEGDLGQRHYHARILGESADANLTSTLSGWNESVLSPDGKSLAVVHSYTNKPPELFVQEAKPSAPATQLTTSPTAEFLAYPWRDVPVVRIPARDGTPVYARLFTPTKRTAATGAAVVFVHGAGYLQNADKGWTEYPREYMFAHFLTERGYTVLDVDYRGSAGYGRDFRTGIYKHMGSKDLSDVVDAVHWLEKTQKVNPERVGIYGGSYGGFLTLMALFKEPDTFRSGAALRPVTDWTKYNHGYTGRILGLPQDDLAAYHRSSPIFFAEGLRGQLLICHGMRDDNVFFQDSVRLTERLIELGKTEHFDTAIYPVESHGFTEPASWTDEYTRIFRLFETTIGK